LAIISFVALVVFVIYELVVEHPVVDLRAFKERTYSSGVFLMTVLGFVLYGSLVILPIFLQTILGYPALQAGIAMFPRGLGSFIAMPFVGIIMSRFDPRKLLVIGLIACSLSLVLLGTLNLNVGYWEIFWAQFLQGLSLGFLFVPLTTVTMDPIPNEKMGNATSIFNLMRNIGGSMGIALSTTIVARSSQHYTNFLGRNVTPYSSQTQSMFEGLRAFFMSSGADPTTATQRAYAAMFGMVQRQAAMMSFNHTYLFLAILFVIVMPAVFLMRRPKSRGRMAAH
jgi:DHA2 family multidrug resistance protein